MSVPKIRAVAFDLDGLMFNTEELYDEVGGLFLRRRGHAFDAELNRQMMGRPAEAAVPLMIDFYGLSETVQEVLRETDEIFDQILPQKLAPMNGLLGLLETIRDRELPSAITTSSRLAFVQKLLELSKLKHDFAFFITSEKVTQGKPHPEVYLSAANHFGYDPMEVMVLEDSEIGCRAAVAAGCCAIAVPTYKSQGHCFEGAYLICDSLADPRIQDLLNGSFIA